MSVSLTGTVLLRDLAGSHELRGLDVLHLASPMSPVRDLALLTDVEEIATVGPDTVVLLTREVARGGWVISAALRYAWERKACALIVPQQSTTGTVRELAERLDVSLLTTNENMTKLAIDMAMQIGVARAGVLSRVQSFSERISRETTLDGALDCVSIELAGAGVAIETAGTTVFHRGVLSTLADASEIGRGTRIVVPLGLGSAPGDALVATVAGVAEANARHVLETAGPHVRALLAETRLRALQAALPVMSYSTLTGTHLGRGFDAPPVDSAAGTAPWPLGGRYIAICLLADDVDRAAPAVHHLWTERFESLPLSRFSEGWVGCVPVTGDGDRARLIADISRRIAHASPRLAMIGVSRERETAEDAPAAIREAWLAARLADPEGPIPIVDFEGLHEHLLSRLLPEDFAAHCAAVLFPRLVADDQARELIAAVVAYLECCGSVTRAAERIGVHRNTLQSRLQRAEGLGVALARAPDLLDTFMLLASLHRSALRSPESTR